MMFFSHSKNRPYCVKLFLFIRDEDLFTVVDV